jgi:hypothetical protein
MNFKEVAALVSMQPDGVVLLEGRRSISADDAGAAKRCAILLARGFPRLRFRSGNADGSDDAFSQGVAEVDASRLQIVAPYENHKKGSRYPDASYDSPASLTPLGENEVAYITKTASPHNKSLIDKRGHKGPIGAKAAYLMRDTMKVIGHSEEFPRPILALFYVDPSDPLAGGTGHTIRVCQMENVPYVTQDSWMNWEEEGMSCPA